MVVNRIGRQNLLQRWHQFANQNQGRSVAYFCMEYGLQKNLPIYSGGLGILAGDTLKSAADKGVPVMGVGILYRSGYFNQTIRDGRQITAPEKWDPATHPDVFDLGESVALGIEGRNVTLRLWGVNVEGYSGNFVPLILLDSAGFPNPAGLEDITRHLYPSDPHARLYQEMVLGIGGMRALERLGMSPTYYHLNEGHAAFAPLEFLNRLGKSFADISQNDRNMAGERFGFTTHTPVPAGFDTFHHAMVESAFSEGFLREAALNMGQDPKNTDFINMAYLAMRLCGMRNGVSRLHAEVSEEMFPDFKPIIPITNGVHHLTWTAEPISKFFDEYSPGWREDPTNLVTLQDLLGEDIFRHKFQAAHQTAKAELIRIVKEKSGIELDPSAYTVGFARRFATYKQGDLILSDLEELRKIADEVGPLQLLFAGKAHPRDGAGQGLIANVIKLGHEITENSGGKIKVIFLEGYDIDLAKHLVAGVDAWLNNPLPPNEASGTSGMKAALNGVPQISTWDGWWVEGARNDSTGYTIGKEAERSYSALASALYGTLRQAAGDYYRGNSDGAYLDKMILAAARNGAYFNTHRMVDSYLDRVWSPGRILTPRQLEDSEPPVAAHKKLVNLSDASFELGRSSDLRSIEHIVAQTLIENLRRSFRVTRYGVHKESVRISRRWMGGKFGNVFYEENRPDFGTTKFAFWQNLEDFKGEVMADLLQTGKIQLVGNPAKDPRCYRDGKLVSENPFILVPETVNGKILGVYKIDFRPTVNLGEAYENEFVNKLFHLAGLAKSAILKHDLARDLQTIDSYPRLINWALTLVTAGGFVDMPRYAVETNRAAFFENTEDGLVGRLAIGAVNHAEHGRALVELSKHLFASGVEAFLREYDQSSSSLSRHILDQNIGENAVPGPILVSYGTPIYDTRDFSSSFDARHFAALKNQIEKLMRVDGSTPEEYLLLPVADRTRRSHGLIYLDNAFAADGKTEIKPENYRHITCVLGNCLSAILAGK